VALFIETEENLNFYVTENIYVHVDDDKLNDILSTSRRTKVDEAKEID
jgi:hypothetical protein